MKEVYLVVGLKTEIVTLESGTCQERVCAITSIHQTADGAIAECTKMNANGFRAEVQKAVVNP